MTKPLAVLTVTCMAAALMAGCGSSSQQEGSAASTTAGEQASGELTTTAENDPGKNVKLRVAWGGNQQRTDEIIAVFDQFGAEKNVTLSY